MTHPYVTNVTLKNNQIVLTIQVDEFSPGEPLEISGQITQSGGAFATIYTIAEVPTTPNGDNGEYYLVVVADPIPPHRFRQDQDVTVFLRVAKVSVTVLVEEQPEPGQPPVRGKVVSSPDQAELAEETTTWNNIRAAATVALSTDSWGGRPALASGTPSAMSAGDPAAHPASGSDAKVTDAEQIENQLFSEFAQRAQAPITPASAVDFFRIVQGGVLRMVQEGRTGAGDVAKATSNLQRFLEEMEKERLRISPSAYHETTVATANMRLCPGLWPFC
jgi:hypothetical protein